MECRWEFRSSNYGRKWCDTLPLSVQEKQDRAAGKNREENCSGSSVKTRAGHSLISLKSNERLWAIRSDHSRQISDCEQIAQVAQAKWAKVCESLRLLMTNFWLKKSKILFLLCFIYVFLFLKMSDSLIPSFLMIDVSKSLRSLTKNERC